MRATAVKSKSLKSYFPLDGDLKNAVEKKIPRSVSLPRGFTQILLKGFEYVAEKILPTFTPEQYAVINEQMYGDYVMLGRKFVVEFPTEVDKIRFYKRLKHLKAELQKKVPKTKVHYFNVATLAFRAFVKDEFPVQFN